MFGVVPLSWRQLEEVVRPKDGWSLAGVDFLNVLGRQWSREKDDVQQDELTETHGHTSFVSWFTNFSNR
jgi:hypothetical protein